MFRSAKKKNNSFNCNELIKQGMIKRRRLSNSAISKLCNIERIVKVVK